MSDSKPVTLTLEWEELGGIECKLPVQLHLTPEERTKLVNILRRGYVTKEDLQWLT